MKTKRFSLILIGCACALTLAAVSWAAPPDKAVRITLTRRADNGSYGKSAYSFRYASQDVRDHMNAVDLIFNACGNLHFSEGGAANRVAKSKEIKLSKLEALPESEWSTACITPEKSAVYVMEINDDFQRFHVKFRVTEAKQDKVAIEWQRLIIQPTAERGTFGQCGGPHECR